MRFFAIASRFGASFELSTYNIILLYSISNGRITAVVKEQGAELSSLVSNKTGLEYIWQAGSQWPRSAPVLFPIVGGLKNGEYLYKEKMYKLPRHGFARDKIFKLKESDSDKLSFQLVWDEESLALYPFKFILMIKYSLTGDTFITEYSVINAGADAMYFSLGAHPAFRVPLANDEYNDYYLQFNRKENADRLKLSDGLIDSREPFFNQTERLQLHHSLFVEDALVFDCLDSNRISIKSNKHEQGVHFTFDDFPYFGIWAAPHAGFVCLEPWHGIADHAHSDKQLINKEGIRLLKPSETFECSYSINIF